MNELTAFIVIFALICVFVALYIFMISPENNKEDYFPENLKRPYAHRGLHGNGIPENSLPAFSLAVTKGYGIELDVRLSKDGKVMVFHDDDLLRMCSVNEKFKNLTYAELEQLRLSNSDCVIPTLEEVLKTVNGTVPLLIELKGDDRNTSLCDKLIPILDRYNGVFLVESFNPLLLRDIRKKRPAFIRGQLVDMLTKESYKGPAPLRFMLSHLWLNFLSRPNFIAYNEQRYPKIAIFLSSYLFGAEKFVWTVKRRDDYLRFKEKNISSVFENFEPYNL